MAKTSLVDVGATTALEFLANAAAKIGEGPGVLGVTNYDITYDPPKLTSNKITKFKLSVSIRRAHWKGGEADAKNKKAIQEAEALNKAHEEQHEKLAVDTCKTEFAKAEKALIGKSESDVDPAMDAIYKIIDKKYAELDAKEGVTSVTVKPDGTIIVKQVAG